MSEYWITPDSVIFCDGDQGVDVPNHEAVVMTECLRELLSAMELSDNEAVNELACLLQTDDDIIDQPMMSEILNNAIDEMISEGSISEEDGYDIYDFIRKHIKDVPEWVFETSFGRGDYDTRAYAVIHWGWTRVTRREVQTAELTKSNLKHIANGLWEAFGDEVESMEFTLEVHKSLDGKDYKLYHEVPYMAIDAGDISFIRREAVA